MRTLAAVLVAAALLAGCSGAPVETEGRAQGDGSPPASPAGAGPASRAGGPQGDGDGDRVAGVPAPSWSVGDWWTWRVTTQDSDPFEVTTVVTAAGADSYEVGVADLEAGLHAFADHVLALGRIAMPSFTWEVHDLPASVVRFPLAPGLEWTGEEEGRTMRFTAEAATVQTPWGAEPAVAALGMTDSGPGVGFVYLPAIRNFASYSIHYGNDEPYATAAWVANGTGGLEATSLSSDDAYIGFAGFPPFPQAPDPEGSTFTVGPGATHVYLACFAGGAGAQHASAVAPSGRTLSCQHAPPQGTNQSFAGRLAEAEPGTWAVALAAAGGSIEAEVYALTLSRGP